MMTIHVAANKQQLMHYDQSEKLIACYPISTAKNGLGERKNSYQTPRGWHQIRAKIGSGYPINTVFRGRRATGEIYQSTESSDQDWILTRILWLSGLTVGLNRLGDVDTMQRYIYIHGTADEAQIGQPVSHGCIRMRNQDILELFDQVSVGELVHITA